MTDQRSNPLSAIYNPRSIAVVGASNNKLKFGGRPIHYMQRLGFAGELYPINPNSTEIQGLRPYPSLAAVGASIDLALIAVPAAGVVGAARDCAAAGVRVAVVIASGFTESDADGEGAKWQSELCAIAASSGMRIIGPNCMGTAAVHSGAITTFATFYDMYTPRPGGIAIASQSGAVGGHTLVLAAERGLGIHSMVTTGNECDVDVAECILYAADDPSVSVIAAYFEGCKHPEILREALERARVNRKPVVALKVGSTELGAQAAGTHTASLAGSDAAFDAVLKAHGAYRAESLDDLLEMAAACDAGMLPSGKRLGVVTVSGGGGVMAADAAGEFGLDVPALPDNAQHILKQLMPFAAVRNPVDTTAQVSNDMNLLRRSLEVVLDEGSCDAVLVFLTYAGTNPRIWAMLKVMLIEFRQRSPRALVVLTGLYRPEDAVLLREHGYLIVEDLRTGVKAVSVLDQFRRSFDAPASTARVSMQASVELQQPGPLNEHAAARILSAAGVPMAPAWAVTNAEEAVAAHARAGGPVVVKLLSPDIVHKSDIGGVKLGLNNAADVRDAFDSVVTAGRAADGDARIDGALVAPMIGGGVETILGIVMDDAFGPAVMFGLGGVFTEIFEDVAFRIAPIDTAQAHRMIRETRGFALLDGVRGRAPADVDALAEALAKLSEFAVANRDWIAGIDINPFVVRDKGEGAIGLDAVIALRD